MSTSVEPAKPKRGGRRPGAGRKKSREHQYDPSHAKRPALSSRHPVHVILRTRKDVPRLRQRCMYAAIRGVLVRCVGNQDFRVVHVSIQHNHLHLIVEAANEQALSAGMKRFATMAARAINKAWGRTGKVFAFRYKASQITTRDYARNALAYVLNNWRRHREDFFDGASRKATLDPYSSAITFDGWRGNRRWIVPKGYEPLPVARPRTSLLRSDWRWRGLLDPLTQPGPLW